MTELFKGNTVTLPIVVVISLISMIYWFGRVHTEVAGLREDLKRIELTRFTDIEGKSLSVSLGAQIQDVERTLSTAIAIQRRDLRDLCHDLADIQQQAGVTRTNNCDRVQE